MADVKFRTVSATLNTSAGTQDITLSGFGTPKAVIAIYGGENDGTARTDAGVFGVGFSDGTTTYSSTISTDDNVSPTITKRLLSNTRLIHLIDDLGLNEARVEFGSFITDGVRLNITQATTATRNIVFVLIGGSDISQSKTGSINISTTSPVDVTNVGFNPDLLFFIGNGQALYVSSSTTRARACLGIAHNDGSAAQGSISFDDQNNKTTSISSGAISNSSVYFEMASGVLSKKITVSDFDASGFSVTASAAFSGGILLSYLALKFTNAPDISLDFIDGPTTTGAFSTTAPGIQPDFALGLLSNATAYESSDNDSISVSAFDDTNEFCVSYSSQDAVNPSNTSTKYTSSAISDLKAGTVDNSTATFTSFDASGFTLNFPSLVPVTANKWLFLTLNSATVTSYTLTADAGAITATGKDASLVSVGNQSTTTINMGVPSGYSLVTLTSNIIADGNFSVQPIAGDQILYPSGLNVNSQLNISGDSGNYVIYHIVASTGVVYHTNYILGDSGLFTDSINLNAGALYTTAKLQEGFDSYVFQQWTTQPVVGDQLITRTSEGYFDNLGNYYSESEQIHDAWHISLNGTTTFLNVDSTGLGSPADTTPDAFSFNSVVGQNISTQIESSSITVLGVTAATNVSISVSSGSEYAVSTDGVNFGSWQTAAGNVQLNNVVKLRTTTPDTYSTQKIVSLNIGGVIGQWSINTIVADTTPTQFTFVDASGQNRNILVESNEITVLGITQNYNVPISVANGEYAISTDNGQTFGSWTSAAGNVQLGYKVKVRHTTSNLYLQDTATTLDINGVLESFITTTIDQALDITPDSFSFTDLIDQTISTSVESESKQVTGLTPATDISVTVSNGEYAISSDNVTFSAFTSLAGNIQNGQYIKLRQTTSADYYVKTSSVLTIGTFSTTWGATTVSLSVPQFNVTDPNVTVERFYGDSFRIRALKNYDNWVQFECYNEDAIMNLSNATDFELKLTNAAGTTYSLLRSTSPNYFTIRPNLGIVEVMIGMSSAPVGDYLVDLIYFDALHTNGAVLTSNRQIVLDLV